MAVKKRRKRALPRPDPASGWGHDEYLIEKPTGLFDALRRALVIERNASGAGLMIPS